MFNEQWEASAFNPKGDIMHYFSRMKNRAVASVLTRVPFLARRVADGCDVYEPRGETPWAPWEKKLSLSKLALVSTCGIHHVEQKPFDMNDPEGDPSFRVIDGRRPTSDLKITHDYYDHSDADRDINVVFPIERMKEFEREGVIGSLADRHFGFMGHIKGGHVDTLIERSAPQVAGMLREDGVDAVFLTPA